MGGEHGLFVVGETNKQKNNTDDVRKEDLCLFQGFERSGFIKRVEGFWVFQSVLC